MKVMNSSTNIQGQPSVIPEVGKTSDTEEGRLEPCSSQILDDTVISVPDNDSEEIDVINTSEDFYLTDAQTNVVTAHESNPAYTSDESEEIDVVNTSGDEEENNDTEHDTSSYSDVQMIETDVSVVCISDSDSVSSINNNNSADKSICKSDAVISKRFLCDRNFLIDARMQCEVCNERFVSLGELQGHTEKRHKMSLKLGPNAVHKVGCYERGQKMKKKFRSSKQRDKNRNNSIVDRDINSRNEDSDFHTTEDEEQFNRAKLRKSKSFKQTAKKSLLEKDSITEENHNNSIVDQDIDNDSNVSIRDSDDSTKDEEQFNRAKLRKNKSCNKTTIENGNNPIVDKDSHNNLNNEDSHDLTKDKDLNNDNNISNEDSDDSTEDEEPLNLIKLRINTPHNKTAKKTLPEESTEENVKSCLICSKIMPNKEAYSKHLSSDHKFGRLKVQHTLMKANVIRRPYPCSFCYLSYEIAQHLNRHVKEKHYHEEKKQIQIKSETIDDDEIRCKMCRIILADKETYSSHLRTQHKFGLLKVQHALMEAGLIKKKFPCELCFLSYDRRQHLSRHLLEKHGTIKEEVDEDEKSLNSGEDKLGKKYYCSFCKHKFTSALRLNAHLERIHRITRKMQKKIKHVVKNEESDSSFESETSSDSTTTQSCSLADKIVVEIRKPEDRSKSTKTDNRKPASNKNPMKLYSCTRCSMDSMTILFLKKHMETVHSVQWEDDAVEVYMEENKSKADSSNETKSSSLHMKKNEVCIEENKSEIDSSTEVNLSENSSSSRTKNNEENDSEADSSNGTNLLETHTRKNDVYMEENKSETDSSTETNLLKKSSPSRTKKNEVYMKENGSKAKTSSPLHTTKDEVYTEGNKSKTNTSKETTPSPPRSRNNEVYMEEDKSETNTSDKTTHSRNNEVYMEEDKLKTNTSNETTSSPPLTKKNESKTDSSNETNLLKNSSPPRTENNEVCLEENKTETDSSTKTNLLNNSSSPHKRKKRKLYNEKLAAEVEDLSKSFHDKQELLTSCDNSNANKSGSLFIAAKFRNIFQWFNPTNNLKDSKRTETNNEELSTDCSNDNISNIPNVISDGEKSDCRNVIR